MLRSRGAALTVSATLLGVASSVFAQDGEDARALLDRMLHAIPRASFTAKARLRSGGGWVRDVEVRHRRIGNVEATLLEVTAPSDVQDTRFLLLEEAPGSGRQFIYMPAVRRTIELMGDSLKQPFLGSDFYVSDLVAPDPDAFDLSIEGAEEVGGHRCKLIAAVPKRPADAVYGRSIFAVDPDVPALMRAQFFDHKQAPFKVWTLGKLERIDGIWTPIEQEMVNLKTGSRSRLELAEVRYGVELPEHLFTREYLRR